MQFDFKEYLRKVDLQIEAKKQREQQAKQGDRRQKNEPVAEDRRSGHDRRKGRGVMRAILDAVAEPSACNHECQQGDCCTCRKSA